MDRPLLVLTGRHRPHELAWLGYCALAGLSILLTAPAPTSVLATMDRWMVYAWGGLLLLSGILGIGSAIARRNIERRLGDELAAMFLNTAALVVFATAILVYAPGPGWFVAGALGIWGGANLWRAQQIMRDVREIRHGRG